MTKNPGARKKQYQADAKADYIGMAATALAQYPIIYLEGYCDWPDCPVREVDVRVKDYDKTLLGRWQQRAPGCPLCKRALKIHNVVTRNQRDEDEERSARFSVNCQMYSRDHPDELGIPIFEIGYELPAPPPPPDPYAELDAYDFFLDERDPDAPRFIHPSIPKHVREAIRLMDEAEKREKTT